MPYKHIIRPFFFRWDPEKVHHFVTHFIKISFYIPCVKALVARFSTVSNATLEKELFGLHFRNPVGLAAGFDKNGEFLDDLSAFGFGFIEVGAVTPKPQAGNPKPRLFRLPFDEALINRMGFNNKGSDALVHRLAHRKSNIIVGVNLGKNSATPNAKAANDYVLLFKKLFDYADYFVVNVSCPNITDLRELQDKEHLTEILVRIQKINRQKPKPKPVLLKVSPDLNNHQLDEVIQLVANTGIAGVVAVNTSSGRNGMHSPESVINKLGSGGVSGKPIKKRAIEVVQYLSEKSNKAFPIIGVGGIFSPDDAKAMLAAGADLIQIYTGFIYEGPFIAKKINKVLAGL